MRNFSSTTPHTSPSISRESEVDYVVTRRNVRVILIAGDQVGSPGLPTPGATDSLDIIEQDIRSRFPGGGTRIERLVGRPTKQLVMAAFDRMQAIVKRDELFVVMFAGHGRPATASQRAQAWSLTGDEVFTDLDLATTLRGFPARLDTVVISNCCYGEGLFRVANRARGRHERPPRNTPMVCISGAGTNSLVELTRLTNLAREVVAAAGARQSYRQLSETFAATAVAGQTFHVDARPASRLGDPVMGTEARVPKSSSHSGILRSNAVVPRSRGTRGSRALTRRIGASNVGNRPVVAPVRARQR